MSLAKNVTLSTGVVATYWVLRTLYLDTVLQTAKVQMNGYLDDTTYTNGDDPVTIQEITVAFVPTNPLPGGVPVLTALYAKVLLDEFFTDGTFTSDGV